MPQCQGQKVDGYKVRLRLFFLLVVPATALLVLASIVVAERHTSYRDANRATDVAILAGVVANLDEALGDESMSSAQFFLGLDQASDRTTDVGSDRAQVDLLIAELEEAIIRDSDFNRGLFSAVQVIKETLSYRADVDSGRITPLQIADRYAHIRGELIDSLGRRAAATTTKDGTLALNGLVELIESRSVHVDERLAVQLGILYEQWAVGQHSAVIRAIAIQDEKVGTRSQLALQTVELRVPGRLQAMREELAVTDGVPDLEQQEWLDASNEWLAVLDRSVEGHYSQLLELFEAKERQAATERTAAAVAVGTALILAFLVTGQVSYRLVRRISMITDQAKRLAAGSVPDPTAPDVRGRDEIGQLASTFDDMNSRLATASRLRELESAALEGIAHGDPLEEILEISARLLGTDAHGDATCRFTSLDPQNGCRPIAESVDGSTPLWLVNRNGTGPVQFASGAPGRSARGLAVLAQSRADANAQLAEHAEFDALTGLLNRRSILDRSSRHDHAPFAESTTGFVFIDLDDFKRINDNFGHLVGDGVLVAQAHRMRTMSHELGGWAGRLGGDEFLVVLPGLHSEGRLAEIAEHFVSTLSLPLSVRTRTIACTASAGAVMARAGVSTEDLRHEADQALYEAKNSGRGVVVVATEALRLRVRASEELRVAFRDGLQASEFIPYFQPIWSGDGTVLSGLEALARWKRPGIGITGPSVFLPVAEELGLLREIDESMFRKVCEQISGWRAAGFTVPPVHVNASSVRIDDVQLVSSTLNILAECGCPPAQIILEVTESGLMADLASSRNSLQRLRDSGIRIAADDFGSGYSSLSYLKGLPVDLLKIDRQFIDSIDLSPPSQAIVAAVRTMAAALGMEVIGEGVERPEELAYLTSIGCDQVQGYLLGRPAPAAETGVLLGEAQKRQATIDFSAAALDQFDSDMNGVTAT